MLVISATEEWRTAHPGAVIGLLELAGLDNTGTAARLEDQKRAVEARLQARYRGSGRPDFLAQPVMSAYARYYKRFSKTYHVLLQLESIVLKEKSLPSVSPLVDANFAAEVETLVLTAGHDADRLHGPVTIDVSREGDQMTQMNGAPRALLAGDMIMRDAQGICCSIIYGQDNRSPISPQTSHALYVAYAPAGVPAEAVEEQLAKIVEHVRLLAPSVVVAQSRLLKA
jgi:DNA/RNA-binding domain of Phe-tRNA-synthetase-like protein